MFFVQAGISCMWTNDSQQLLLENFDKICHSPSQLYHSALPFCPSSSWLCECYSQELSQEATVVKGLSAEWEKCTRTVPLNDCPLSLSYWNNTIVIGSTKGDILIHDAITGSQKAVLRGHTDYVKSVTFSSDGILLVSGSYDKTVKLWDVQTGGVIRTFHGHTRGVLSVSISADHTIIASGSFDKTLCLWNIQEGKCHQIIEHQEEVSCVRFSPTDPQCLISCVKFSPTDPQCLISVSGGTVKQWNIDGCKVGHTYTGYQVSFSPDGTQFILHRLDGVTVHNINSGLVVAEFHIKDSSVSCFSPDSKLIAVVTGCIIYVWDITGLGHHFLGTFSRLSGSLSSLVFSSPSTFISAYLDNLVRFWQIGASSTGPPVTIPKSTHLISAPTKSAALKPKNELIIPSDLPHGVGGTWSALAAPLKKPSQIPVEGSHQNNTQMIDNKLAFIWYADEKINIWDAEKGRLLQTINVPGGGNKGLMASGDGTKVFCLDNESIQAWDICIGEAVGKMRAQDVNIQTKDGMGADGGLGVLGIDGSKIWVNFSTPGGSHSKWWDFGIPGSPQCLSHEGFPDRIYLNGNKVWEVNTSKMKDIVTGRVVFQLPVGFNRVFNVQWNGYYLVVFPRYSEVVIVDFSHMSLK